MKIEKALAILASGRLLKSRKPRGLTLEERDAKRERDAAKAKAKRAPGIAKRKLETARARRKRERGVPNSWIGITTCFRGTRVERDQARKASDRKHRVLKLTLPYVDHITPMPVDGRCPHCRVPMVGKWPAADTPTLDHIVPLAKGGHHVPDNTQMICFRCNSIKGDRPLSFLLKRLAIAPDQCAPFRCI